MVLFSFPFKLLCCIYGKLHVVSPQKNHQDGLMLEFYRAVWGSLCVQMVKEMEGE